MKDQGIYTVAIQGGYLNPVSELLPRIFPRTFLTPVYQLYCRRT